jgi:hydroxypyruvate isomerase
MPRFAANLSMLFTEAPFMQRFALAAQHGFTAVECQFPYAFDAVEIKEQLDSHKLEMVLHNLPAGNWQLGERGIACHPDRVDEFKAGVQQAVAYAQALNVKQLNCLVGIAPVGIDANALKQTLVNNLQYAAQVLKDNGLRLLLEPINTFDVPGFFINRTQQAIEVLDALGADNVFVQYDIYHAQRMEGELTSTLQKHLQRIGHIQLADNPGRHEPGTGEINFAFLLPVLDRMGYKGWVGCEYIPAAGTVAGLGWMRDFTANY